MLNDNEKKLLTADIKGFPLLTAAQTAWKRCGTCGHNNVNVNTMLRAVTTAYMNNKEFKMSVSKLFNLPASIGGLILK